LGELPFKFDHAVMDLIAASEIGRMDLGEFATSDSTVGGPPLVARPAWGAGAIAVMAARPLCSAHDKTLRKRP
jgi:hypothetical protein